MKGTVKWFNTRKGYGFIKGEDGEEYFVHHTALGQGTFVREDDEVDFEAADTDRGKQAKNITLLKKGSEVRSDDDDGAEATEDSTEDSEEEAKDDPAEEEAEQAEEAPAEDEAKEE
ncbi:cold shock domain-containing protein [archaeon]|nr:cold shock domain-containing protein [archaeon]MBT4417379.1 cold shock domain-containing protein [archaeon]